MYCCKCNCEISEDSKFCKECGAEQKIKTKEEVQPKKLIDKSAEIEAKIQQDINNGVPILIAHFDEDKNTTFTEKYNLENVVPDEFAMKGMCSYLAKECEKYYSDPENVKKYEEWKAKKYGTQK